MDVTGAASACVARPELELDLRGTEAQPVLLHRALHAGETHARFVVVVEPRALPGHPREHPRVHPVVLVDELETAPVAVGADQGLPELRALPDAASDVLELLGGQEAIVRDETRQR